MGDGRREAPLDYDGCDNDDDQASGALRRPGAEASRLTTTSFSLIRGGPAYRLQRGLGLIPASGLGVPRRAVLLAVVAWVPMTLLALFARRLFPGEVAEPLIQRFAVHAQCLIAIPLFVLGEAVAERALPQTLAYFVRSGLVGERSGAAFANALAAAERVRDSTIGVAVLLGVVVIGGAATTESAAMSEGLSWAATGDGGLLAAGWWYVLVVRPLFSLLIGLWLWRLIVLWVLFRGLAGLDLELDPTHPDKAGGLGFLGGVPAIFVPVVLAPSSVLAARLAHEEGDTAGARGSDPVNAYAVAAMVAALAASVAAESRAAGGAGSTASYVGAARCAECHAKESEAWRGSHHALAMQEATSRTVRGNFADTRFRYGAVASRFFRRNGKFWVRTDGADGRLADFEIRYTFGVAPLQQYLIALPDGRLQALSIAWDSRPRSAGGQRWFHLYPDEKVDFRDVLHWTGAAQNWNHQCAECHSTGIRKSYRPDTSRFATTWTDINVACEACHGPGSRHVAWAASDRTSGDAAKGLDASLSPGAGSFAFAADAGIARLVGSRDTGPQIAACGRCHARRAEISEDWHPGRPLTDTHVVSLLDEGLYEADGQMRDEVYEYGSFLQSRMHAQGVACSDCHDPHAGGLRAQGNAVCTACHAPATYDVASHHHHREGSEATRCVACHMPSRLYMVIDRRHDHGFRVPRPDLSVELGTPNACTDCHRDRPPAWAAAAVTTWYGPTRTHGPSWARALAAGRRREASAAALLADVVGQTALPAIVRATALELSSRFPRPAQANLVTRALGDADPLVRRAALGALLPFEPAARSELAAPFLADPVRTVRLEAVSIVAEGTVPAASQHVFDQAVEEFRAVQALNADRADAWLNLGVLDSRLGNAGRAEAAYRRAIRLQPDFVPAYVNLADFYRTQRRDPEGERVLRQALARHPDAGDVHHALGLLLVREKRPEEATAELARAAKLAPDRPRYAYAHALALDGMGKRREALAILAEAQHRFPGDREILDALVQLSVDMQDREAAARWAEQLRALDGRPR